VQSNGIEGVEEKEDTQENRNTGAGMKRAPRKIDDAFIGLSLRPHLIVKQGSSF
jgi:hypothetical protein